MGKVFHVMAGTGNFSEHVKQITGIPISDSALSQRGASIGWELVATALRSTLRPLADPRQHADAFHRGLRLLGIDGTRFNMCNAPAINARAIKNRCWRGDGEPAFAHLCSVVVVELGTHQPLSAAFGWENQGELTLARQAVAEVALPPRSLLLGDRLFGTPSFIHELVPALEATGGGLLFRVKANMESRLVERFADGSRLVDVEVRDTKTRKPVGVMRLREIHAEVRVDDGKGKALEIRLWTNLLDHGEHPAMALVELYARRWEHELFYRELKSNLHGGGMLRAHTPESAVQEALAMMMAASLVARQRAAVAAGAGVGMRRISFAKVLDATVAVCRVFEIGRDLIGENAREEWVRRLLEELAVTALIPERKPRSCTRGVRQPTKNWKKIRKPTSKLLVKTITLTNP